MAASSPTFILFFLRYLNLTILIIKYLIEIPMVKSVIKFVIITLSNLNNVLFLKRRKSSFQEEVLNIISL